MKTFTETDIQRVKPSFEMLVQTGIISDDNAKNMVSALIQYARHPESNRPTLLKRQEVADYLRITTIQVDRLAKQGKLRKLKLGENTTRYSESDVIQFALGDGSDG